MIILWLPRAPTSIFTLSRKSVEVSDSQYWKTGVPFRNPLFINLLSDSRKRLSDEFSRDPPTSRRRPDRRSCVFRIRSCLILGKQFSDDYSRRFVISILASTCSQMVGSSDTARTPWPRVVSTCRIAVDELRRRVPWRAWNASRT